jgi:hypothetical protein
MNTINYKTINTQTKVRRLAYLKMIMTMFNRSNYYPIDLLYKKIELEAKDYNSDLLEYVNSKGIIEVTRTGNSSKPYIETSLTLKLLFTQNNMCKISKYGKIFNVLAKELNDKTNNYFLLAAYEKTFLLYHLLKNDRFYIQLLMNIVLEKERISIKKLKDDFQGCILHKLKEDISSLSLSSKIKNEIMLRIKRVEKWENPKRYLEHIVEPRVNWLLDLDFLEQSSFKKGNLVLSKKGLTFIEKINKPFNMDKEFFTLSKKIYQENNINVEESNFELIANYLEKSFILFKTSAPNRVTASQAILYTCYMLLFQEKKVVNFSTIQDYLNSKENTKFIYDWYKTEQDGSIRRRK